MPIIGEPIETPLGAEIRLMDPPDHFIQSARMMHIKVPSDDRHIEVLLSHANLQELIWELQDAMDTNVKEKR